MLALRTGIPHTVWADDPQAVYTAADLLGWLEDEEVGTDELWRAALNADKQQPGGDSVRPQAGGPAGGGRVEAAGSP